MMLDFGVMRLEMKWGKEITTATLIMIRRRQIIFLLTIVSWPFGHLLDYWIISHPPVSAQLFHLSHLVTGQLIVTRIPYGARAFSQRSKRDTRKDCAARSGQKRKRYIVEHTEIYVARHYNSAEVVGLYPGMVPVNMRMSGLDWELPILEGGAEWVEFPLVVKVSHGFLDLGPVNEQPVFLHVIHHTNRRSWHWLWSYDVGETTQM